MKNRQFMVVLLTFENSSIGANVMRLLPWRPTIALLMLALVLSACGVNDVNNDTATNDGTQTPGQAQDSLARPSSAVEPSPPVNNGDSGRIESTEAERHDSVPDDEGLEPDKCLVTSSSLAAIPDPDTLAWSSQLIVRAVIEYWHPTVPYPNHPRQPSYTLYDIRVLDVIRGPDVKTLRVVAPGGEIPGKCVSPLHWDPEPEGTELMLFLASLRVEDGVVVYRPVGGVQGRWHVVGGRASYADGGMIGFLDNASVDAVVDDVVSILGQGAPTVSVFPPYQVVPLSKSALQGDVPERLTFGGNNLRPVSLETSPLNPEYALPAE